MKLRDKVRLIRQVSGHILKSSDIKVKTHGTLVETGERTDKLGIAWREWTPSTGKTLVIHIDGGARTEYADGTVDRFPRAGRRGKYKGKTDDIKRKKGGGCL